MVYGDVPDGYSRNVIRFQGTTDVRDVEQAFVSAGYISPVLLGIKTSEGTAEACEYDLWICHPSSESNRRCAAVVMSPGGNEVGSSRDVRLQNL